MSNLILSAFSDEYAEPFAEQLAGMQALSIGYIELRHANGKNISTLTHGEVMTLKKQLDTHGIRVSAIGSPLGKIRLDEDLDAHLDMAKRVFESAAVLDTKLVRMFSFYAPAGKNITDCRAEVLAALSDLLALARQYGITLCHENEASIYGDTPSRCLELMNAFGGKLKCVFDMGNFVLEGVDPYPEAYTLLQKHIAYFHIKDALPSGAIVPPGKGNAKIGEILTAHRAYARSDFFVSLEPHLQVFAGLDRLVGREFEKPYCYPDSRTAFTDAAQKLKELI